MYHLVLSPYRIALGDIRGLEVPREVPDNYKSHFLFSNPHCVSIVRKGKKKGKKKDVHMQEEKNLTHEK